MKSIRPANMRTTHGLQGPFRLGVHSVSAVACVEDVLSDPEYVAVSGSGMDSPCDVPTGSLKAFFATSTNEPNRFIGITQRTINR
jgi:hypothetical protein